MRRDLTESSLSALVINPTYNMAPCRGRGRLLGSKGPLFLMRAPVLEDKRSTFTSRGYMTGYTINPRIGSTSTRLGGPEPACLGTTRGTCTTRKNYSTGHVGAGLENAIFEGRRAHVTLRMSERYLCISLGITCLEEARSVSTLGGSATVSVVADNKPVLDSKPNTSSRQWGTRSASNPPGPIFFDLARVSDAPAVSWSPDSVNHSTVEPAV